VVLLRRAGDALIAAPAPAGGGLIEARGVGLLRLPYARAARVALVIDLDAAETDRLPPRRSARLLGVETPLLFASEKPRAGLVAALLARDGPLDPDAPIEGLP
jgi:HPr kinase/phosphorylase